MSLRKSPTMTPARIEAYRRDARKSTGPSTERGQGPVTKPDKKRIFTF